MRCASRVLLLLGLLAVSVSAGQKVTLRRGGDAPSDIRSWFVSLDRLLGRVDALQDSLARAAARPTAGAASRSAERLAALLEDYAAIADDAGGVRKAESFLKGLRASLTGLPADSPLSAETARKVFALGEPSVNRFSELIRQAALETPGRRGRCPANSLLTVGAGAEAQERAFLDVTEKPGVEDGRVVSAALLALVAAGPDSEDAEVSAVAGGRRLWLRAPRVELFGDFSSSRAGAMIRLRREAGGGHALDQARFYFLTRALFETGFAVSVENGVLVALLGGESASLDPYTRIELFAAAWKAYRASESLRPRIKDYLKGTVSEDENARRLDDLAKLFAAEGELPPLRPGQSLREAVGEYLKKNSARETLRAEMDRNLGRWGLGSFPAERPVGQRTIDLYYNAPVEAAIARGELERTPKGVVLSTRFDPLTEISRALRKGPSPVPPLPLAAMMGRARILGIVGGDPVYGSQWRAASDRWLLLRFLRPWSGGPARWAGAWELRAGGERARIPLKGALAELAGLGALPAPGKAASRPAPGGRLSADPSRDFHSELLYSGENGPFEAGLTYDRSKAGSGGRVFATPYLSGADLKAAAGARAVLTTAGGAQTAIFAALSKISAFDLPRGEWSGSAGLRFELPGFGPARAVPGGGPAVRRVQQRRWLVLREGDRLRFYPKRSLIELLPAD